LSTAKFAYIAIGIVGGVEITVIYANVSRGSVESFRRGRRSVMKEKRIGKTSVKAGADWSAFRALRRFGQVRRAIESDPEARPTDAEFLEEGACGHPGGQANHHHRLDADLLEWLRTQKGYQTRINAVLRTYMDANPTSGRRG